MIYGCMRNMWGRGHVVFMYVPLGNERHHMRRLRKLLVDSKSGDGRNENIDIKLPSISRYHIMTSFITLKGKYCRCSLNTYFFPCFALVFDLCWCVFLIQTPHVKSCLWPRSCSGGWHCVALRQALACNPSILRQVSVWVLAATGTPCRLATRVAGTQ